MKDMIISFFESIWYEIYVTLIKEDYWKEYVKGLGVTILLAVLAIVFGTIIGFIVANAIKYSEDTGKGNLLKKICNIYVTIIRGTPIVVQLFIVYYLVFTNVRNGIVIAILAFSLNSGAYVAEIIRSGFNAVDKGQMEAARSLGLSRGQAMLRVVYPQAVRVILPSLGNEFIALIKETSIVGYVTIKDLTKVQEIRSGRTFVYTFPLLLIAAIYLVLVLGLGKIMQKIEKRMNVEDDDNDE